MYAQVEKPKENKSRAVVQKKNNVKQGFRFIDNRPEVITQKKLQERDNKSRAAANSVVHHLKIGATHSVTAPIQRVEEVIRSSKRVSRSCRVR